MINNYSWYFRLIWNWFLLAGIVSSVQSCSNRSADNDHHSSEIQKTETVYAGEFGFQRNVGYTKLWIGNQKDGLEEFYLVTKGLPIPTELENRTNLINVPVGSVVCTSTTQVPWLDMLNASDLLSGFPDPVYLYSEIQRKRLNNGILKDLGGPSGLEAEALIARTPDLVLIFSGMREDKLREILMKTGTPFIQTREHLEGHPLGRAEWIRFMGLLLSKERIADSIFNSISNAYRMLSASVIKASERPVVVTGIPYNGIWYVPGGGSYAATLFSDAGFDYPWSGQTDHSVLPLAFEKVFPIALKADVWIGASNHKTITELIASEKRFSGFKSVQNSQVWVYDNRSLPAGGNDFFEAAGVRPDLVLKDLIRIRTESDSLTFYRRLK